MCSCLGDVAGSFPVIFLSTAELPSSPLVPQQLRFLSSKPKLPLKGNGKIPHALSNSSFWSRFLLSTCCLSWGSWSILLVYYLFNWSVVFIIIFSHEDSLSEKNLVWNFNKIQMKQIHWVRWWGKGKWRQNITRQTSHSPTHTHPTDAP